MNIVKSAWLWMFMAMLILSMTPGAAQAQSGSSTKGIRAGAFTIEPKLTVGTAYSDNIFATKRNKESEWITTVNPEVDVVSGWSRHSLKLNTGLNAGFHASESGEDYVDANIRVDGRIDVRRESFMRAWVGFDRLHEERGSPDVSGAWDEPAVYYRTTGNMSYHHGFNRFSLTAGGGVSRYDYKSVALREGGSQNLSIRDRNVYNLNARMAYELHPDIYPFITASYDWRRYDKSEARRDSQGYRIGAGTGFGITRVISGEVFAGYLSQDYDDREEITGLWYGMSLLWDVTPMTTIKARAESSVMETSRRDSTGIKSAQAGISIDHELLRNLLLGAFMDYERYEYKGENITDDYYTLGPSVTYLWNRYLSAKAQFSHRARNSNRSEREYKENRFSMSITGSF